MDQIPEPTPEQLRIARRFALALRFVVYGAVVLLAVFVLHRRSAVAEDVPSDPNTFFGQTTDMRQVFVRVGDDGRPASFGVRVGLECAREVVVLRRNWDTYGRVRLAWSGDHVEATDRVPRTDGTTTFHLSADLLAGRLVGVVRAEEDRADGGRCWSEAQGFTVRLRR